MTLTNTLLTTLKYASLITVLLQLATFIYVGTNIWKLPEKNLVQLWALFTAYNFCSLTYIIVTFTEGDQD